MELKYATMFRSKKKDFDRAPVLRRTIWPHEPCGTFSTLGGVGKLIDFAASDLEFVSPGEGVL
jgi:hypothetical protein